jgi:hypothetical protein
MSEINALIGSWIGPNIIDCQRSAELMVSIVKCNSAGGCALLAVCLNAKHRMGCPKRDGMNRRRSYWICWSMRQLQPGLDIGADREPVVKRGSEVA